MEIETKVPAITVGVALELVHYEPFFDIHENVGHSFIPSDHLMQVVQQSTVMNASLFFYVIASETVVM